MIFCKIFLEKLRNQTKLDNTENFDICFRAFFERHCQKCLSTGETGY